MSKGLEWTAHDQIMVTLGLSPLVIETQSGLYWALGVDIVGALHCHINVGHNNSLDPTLILIQRIDVGHVDFQPMPYVWV